MILYRVGPGKWLTLQLFLFGIVSTFQAFQRGYAPFIATRFLLGLTESGFIPGGLWTLSTWYTRAETAKRVMFFYFGNQIGQASSKLLAYGILHMRGVGGQPGWFWLFALMGSFTVAAGVVFGLFLPDSFNNPSSTFLPRKVWFTEREIHILRTRVVLDDPMKGKKKKHIGLDAFKRAVSGTHVTSRRADPASLATGAFGSTSSSHCATMARSVRLTRTRLPLSIRLALLRSPVTHWLRWDSGSRSQCHMRSATCRITCKAGTRCGRR
jgi:MFS family permease